MQSLAFGVERRGLHKLPRLMPKESRNQVVWRIVLLDSKLLFNTLNLADEI